MAGELQKLHKGKGSILRPAQIAAIQQLRKLAKTQTEIAQAIGCDQSTVSRWLEETTDTRDAAAAYLDGQSLHLARKAVKRSTAADAIKLLQGRNVLQNETNGPNIIIQIGGNDVDVCLVTAQNQTSYEKEHGSK